MKKFLAITLGILSAIGGFVDIGDIVANAEIGARFGVAQVWVLLVGVVGICVYAEMCGRVAAMSGRPVFDIVRERLGPRVALANLGASYLITMLTLAAEIGGVALALQLLSSLPYLIWVPAVAVVLWLCLWRVKFENLERIFGLAGLLLITLLVALFALPAPWGTLMAQATHPVPTSGENWNTYWFFAIALFASALTPYEVFFFSSGGVEEHWSRKDLNLSRINVFLGFPLGGLLAFGFMATAATVYHPAGVTVSTLGQAVLPAGLALGKLALGLTIIGVFAATFGAAVETGLSSGYTIAQYFGWGWGKFVAPRRAARFHTVVLVSILIAVAVLLTAIDPIQLTEYTLVFSAVVLPLTYLPILVVANDRDYLGEHVNGRLANGLGMVYLVIIIAASVAAIPLMIVTGVGQ
jgi:Mn2+/Fe2+ NRAMP family transporter